MQRSKAGCWLRKPAPYAVDAADREARSLPDHAGMG